MLVMLAHLLVNRIKVVIGCGLRKLLATGSNRTK